MNILAPVSPGELLDKITILKIKGNNILDEKKKDNVVLELDILLSCWNASPWKDTDLSYEEMELYDVNKAIWDVEDEIRDKERNKTFDNQFIELARAVYYLNDKRALIKKKINESLGSTIIEEKSYDPY